MKRHAASRQKPVPKLAFMSTLGPSLPEIPITANGVIFTEVIGMTTSLKSSVCSTAEEGGIVEVLGKTFWAAEMGDRQEHAIKIGRLRTDRMVSSYQPVNCFRFVCLIRDPRHHWQISCHGQDHL